MAQYRIYIDEVGNHDLTHADEPNNRFLSLTGVILESSYVWNTVQPELEALKRRFFQTDPDEPIVLHRKEIVNKRYPFQALRDAETQSQFNSELLQALARWQYTVLSVMIDKKEHRDKYSTWQYHPYHYCLKVLIERYVMFLHRAGHRGDVMVESRGGKEDLKLKDSYSRLYPTGSEYVPAAIWQSCLSSKELKAKPKTANIAGLQLADLIAYPSWQEMLRECQLATTKRGTFGEQISEILCRDKYDRNPATGEIWRYGKKRLP